MNTNTNFEQVQAWMRNVNQEVPATPTLLEDAVSKLRLNLIAEESGELLKALEEYAIGIDEGDLSDKEYVAVLKEAADVLVVTYGLFAAMGIDANWVHMLVMRNNGMKVQRAIKREDGKVVVPPEVKAKLKESIEAELLEVIRGE